MLHSVIYLLSLSDVHRLWCAVLSVSILSKISPHYLFLIAFMCGLLTGALLSSQCWGLQGCLCCWFLMNSLWLGDIHCIMEILVNFRGLFFWPSMVTSASVLCVRECVCPCWEVGCSVNVGTVLESVSLLVFCWLLSAFNRSVLELSVVLVDSSPCRSSVLLYEFYGLVIRCVSVWDCLFFDFLTVLSCSLLSTPYDIKVAALASFGLWLAWYLAFRHFTPCLSVSLYLRCVLHRPHGIFKNTANTLFLWIGVCCSGLSVPCLLSDYPDCSLFPDRRFPPSFGLIKYFFWVFHTSLLACLLYFFCSLISPQVHTHMPSYLSLQLHVACFPECGGLGSIPPLLASCYCLHML